MNLLWDALTSESRTVLRDLCSHTNSLNLLALDFADLSVACVIELLSATTLLRKLGISIARDPRASAPAVEAHPAAAASPPGAQTISLTLQELSLFDDTQIHLSGLTSALPSLRVSIASLAIKSIREVDATITAFRAWAQSLEKLDLSLSSRLFWPTGLADTYPERTWQGPYSIIVRALNRDNDLSPILQQRRSLLSHIAEESPSRGVSGVYICSSTPNRIPRTHRRYS